MGQFDQFVVGNADVWPCVGSSIERARFVFGPARRMRVVRLGETAKGTVKATYRR